MSTLHLRYVYKFLFHLYLNCFTVLNRGEFKLVIKSYFVAAAASLAHPSTNAVCTNFQFASVWSAA